jgi:sulfite exporter TauE/SafE
MTPLLATVLLASLLGSLHCAGMCGVFVAFALGSEPGTRPKLALSAAYHGGRLITYTLLGAACGAMGAALDWGGGMLGLSRVAAILAGATMVGFGLVTLLRLRGVRLAIFKPPPALSRAVAAGQRIALGFRPFPRALTIGLLTTLLPCGWLWAFAVTAAGTGSAAWGAATMAAFWLGTVPVLAALGLGIQQLTGRLGAKLPAITATALVVVGLFTVVNRVMIDTSAMASIAPAVEQHADGQVEDHSNEAHCPVCDQP